MKKTTKAAFLSIVPTAEEVIRVVTAGTEPTICWNAELDRGARRVAEAFDRRDLATALVVACGHIRSLEAKVAAFQGVATAV